MWLQRPIQVILSQPRFKQKIFQNLNLTLARRWVSNTKPLVLLSPKAIEKLSSIRTDDINQGKALRLSVCLGGCHGFEYRFSLGHMLDDDWKFTSNHGETIVIDPASLTFLEDCRIDFVDNIMECGFKVVHNSKAKFLCGCRNSFKTD